MDDKLLAGIVVNTHSVKGGLKINSLCDSVDVFMKLKRLYTQEGLQLNVIKMSGHKGFVLAYFEGITDLNEALKYKNKKLYAKREDFKLEKGSYFIADLIGVCVVDSKTNEVYGKITDVLQPGANDVYVVENENRTLMVPVIDNVIDEVDMQNRIIKITPLEGLFD